jgi:hypothetical protein
MSVVIIVTSYQIFYLTLHQEIKYNLTVGLALLQEIKYNLTMGLALLQEIKYNQTVGWFGGNL